jgi:hypothetical protein
MKRWAILCFATLAALATVACVGAGSASATVLCNVPSPCEVTATYPAETTVKASLEEGTESVLSSSLGNVKCTASSAEGKTTKESGEPLPGEITALSFSGCKFGETSCTVTTKNLPYAASVKATSGDNGTLTVENGGSGTPSVFVECKGAISCTYAVPALEAKGGAPAKLIAKEVTLTKLEGLLCPKTSTWSATYVVSAPKPVYVEK